MNREARRRARADLTATVGDALDIELSTADAGYHNLRSDDSDVARVALHVDPRTADAAPIDETTDEDALRITGNREVTYRFEPTAAGWYAISATVHFKDGRRVTCPNDGPLQLWVAP